MKCKLKEFTTLFASLFYCCHLMAGQGIVGFEQHQRLNDQNNSDADKNWFALNLYTDQPKKKIDTYLNVDVRYFHTHQDYMFSVSEVYARYRGRRTELSFGRKIVEWQQSEMFWNLGDLNPNRGFTLIENNKEGLIGLHVDHQMGSFNLSLLASYFYVPQLNPGYDYGDGKITSNSNWVRIPYKATKYRGEVIPINYEIEKPKNSDIILQQTLGGRLDYNWRNGQVYSYGVYKPENSLRYNATANYNPESEQIDVKVRPFVNHHLVYGSGLSQKLGDLHLSSEVETTVPDKKNKGQFFEFEEMRFSPTYIDKTSWRTSATLKKSYFKMGGHFFQLLSHEGRADDFFTEKSQWKRAAGLSLEYLFSDRLGTSLMYKYDFDRSDAIWQNQFDYRISRQMSAGVGMALLVSPSKESYWSPYKSNDSIFTNLNYIF